MINPICKDFEELLECLSNDVSFKEKLRPYLNELMENKKMVLSEVKLPFEKFNKGDIVMNNHGDIGFIVGSLNSFPIDDIRKEGSMKQFSKHNPRYLMVALNPEYVNSFEGENIMIKDPANTITASGLFSIRYPTQKNLQLLLPATPEPSTSKDNLLVDVGVFCKDHCIYECDSTCPLKKYGLSGTSEKG